MILSTHHIGLEVADLFAMEQFYRFVLGFQLNYRYTSANTPGLRTVFLGLGSCRLELLHHSLPTDDHSIPQAKSSKNWGHFALEVIDVEEAWQAANRQIARLNQAQADSYAEIIQGWRAPRQTGDGWTEALIVDPEGNCVELVGTGPTGYRSTIKAVIFDFDGTLADSEPNYFLAAQRLLAEFGVDYSEAENARYIGTGNIFMLKDLIARYQLPISLADLSARKEKIYLELALADTKLFPKMIEFLDLVRAVGLKVAVASGSSLNILQALVRQLGLGDRFPTVLSSESVKRGKPAPDVFLETARLLGVPAANCLVVEDSAPGAEAALRAGMFCLAVPSSTGPDLDPRFGLADHLSAAGMAAFDPHQAFAWVQARL